MRLKTANSTLVSHLEVADTLWTRTKGLLGRKQLAHDRALWIRPCNSIHTFFMKFSIDVVFVDAQMVVRKTYTHVRPNRLIFPVWKAASVIEFSAGFLEKHPLSIGEQLHVDHTLS